MVGEFKKAEKLNLLYKGYETQIDMYYRALSLAVRAHEGQVRKHVGEPYVCHPIRMAKRLRGHGSFVQTVALLHDVVEDSNVTIEEIREHFGNEVAKDVAILTDPEPEFGNRKARKAEVIRKFRDEGSYSACIVKCADIIDNLPSIKTFDPNFFVVFKREKEDLMEALRVHIEHEPIFKEAMELYEDE